MLGWVRTGVVGAVVAMGAARAGAYSVMTHEQLVDLAWKPEIVPLLRARFPGVTDAQLKEAHAYAYGGCAIQDLGYYPFGKEIFSDLTHYVRPGDFVRSLLRNAKTPDELAFAAGALSHFVGDTVGHAEAVNPAVGMEFPGLAAKYGPVVTYDESPHAHVRTEFAFDVNEIAKHRFAPRAYLESVGLEVPTDLLRRAFFETYGLGLAEVLGGKREKPTLFGYRFSVRHFLPRIAYAETVLHRKRMPPDVRDEEFVTLERELARSDFENGWEPYRRKAGIGTYTLAGLIWVLPKVGPLNMLAIKGPTVQTEEDYVKSVNRVMGEMGRAMDAARSGNGAALRVELANKDLDTGAPVRPGTYRLTDETYARLVGLLVERKGKGHRLPTGLKEEINAFYADASAPIWTKRKPEQWARLQVGLGELATMPVVPEP